jgi:type I restriction enzyme M protein
LLPAIQVYAQGVKANVLFFDRKPAAEKPWTEKLWIYDLRTNKHFTLKENPLKRSDLDELESPAAPSPALRVTCYNKQNRHKGAESEQGLLPTRARM